MITILKTDILKFTHILHIADLHIRLNKRHDEYKEVFKVLYEEVKKTPSETVVAFLGDLFHSKSDLSPECIQVASDFITNLANLRPFVIVAGNHDATLSNKSRLDSITPLVDALNNPKVYYLKTTGLYSMGNILFNNMCVFDSPERYIRGQDIPPVYRNQYEHIIALFHGAVDRAALDTGYSISNPTIMPPLFDHNDIALLGDIHKRQDMQDYDPDNFKPCIHYVGSMIQQNHGEELHGHGYSLWDLKTRRYGFHELKNEYGYFTVDIQKGQLTTDLTHLPKKVRLRMKCYESVASEVKKVLADIKMKVQVMETTYVRMDQERDKKDIIPLCKDIVLADLTIVEYQDKLLTEFLTKKLEIVDLTTIDKILKINKKTNLLIKRDDFSRNLKWKPIRFEWDNMFTYGEGNVIDFTNMAGVYGIFGPNKSGKSSILSSIIFCLFDKFDRGYKGLHVLNVQKSSFRCKLEFEISGVRYFIERKGNTTRLGNVKVEVKFWRTKNGIDEELHGTERRDTNDIIRDYIGTYEDFVITAASFQNAKNLTSFIDMGNSERKDLLVQFIGLNVFDRLHESAGERNKELVAVLKTHRDKNYQLDIQQNEAALSHAETLFAVSNEQAESLNKQISEVNEKIVSETANMIKLDTSIPTDLSLLESRKQTSESILTAKRKQISDFRETLVEQEKKLVEINVEVDKIEKSNFVEAHKTYKEMSNRLTALKQKIDLKKVEVKGKLEKVERLKHHKYDPNCKFCVDNDFVKDATKAKTELVEDKKETDKMMTDLMSLRDDIDVYKWVENTYETYTKFLTERGIIKDKCATASKNIIIAINELEHLDTATNTITQQIEIYHRNEVSVENNAKVQSKINAFRATLSKLDAASQKQYQSLMDISGKRELFGSTIKAVKKTLAEVTAMEEELNLYQNYLQAVGRDGIPYQVICNTVPEIEKEVNSILSQVVDYTIQFETDGKNIVPYVVYEYGRWPIELTSGYERFVASVAIRVALTEISNLPRCNMLCVDEGFGTLDPDNLASMPTLFSLLKNYYDFVLVISHLDVLKDAVDKQIEVRRDGNFSFVNYE
jgi:DNA repair exonuclease SbcCD ATPase subunit